MVSVLILPNIDAGFGPPVVLHVPVAQLDDLHGIGGVILHPDLLPLGLRHAGLDELAILGG
jgi:hypothetical protein